MDLSKSENLKIVREEINEALTSVLGKYDLTGKIGGITYGGDGSRFTSRLTVEQNMDDKQRFESYANRMGIDPKLYGKKITISGETMTVVGLKPKSRKNKVIVENAKGKQYVCQLSAIRGKSN